MAGSARLRAAAVEASGAVDSAFIQSRNEVVLAGRVAAPAQERELPSGDTIVTWRLVVNRPKDARQPPPGVRASPVDTFDCVAWDEDTRSAALTLRAGDAVTVSGSLRRRFWRSGAAAASRCEVEVGHLDVLDPGEVRANRPAAR